MLPAAVIDIGTNSVKLLVAALDGERMRVLADELRITRLGEDLRATGALSVAAMRRTVDAVAELLRLARESGAAEVAIVGTMGLRIATNAGEFTGMLRKATGHTVQVLSGQEEARLSYIGATQTLACAGQRLLVFDTGGGSTEFTAGDTGNISYSLSLPLGAAFFTEMFLHRDPPAPEELENLNTHLSRELKLHLPADAADRLVGVGGTVTSIAAMLLNLTPYDGGRVHGMELSLTEVERQLERLAALTLRQRREITGLNPGWAPVIVAGVAVVAAVLRRTGDSCLTVSDHGLRHGVWWSRFGTSL